MMLPICMTIPDDPDELPGWLEAQLVGLDLAQVVAELSALHGHGAALSLAEILGDRRTRVLAEGVRALPESAFRLLLRHPQRLLELQELVLMEGGPYWDRLAAHDVQLTRLVARGKERLQQALFASAASPTPPIAIAWYKRRVVVGGAAALAVAAAVWLVVSVVQPFLWPATRWNWKTSGDLPTARTSSAYLRALAQAAENSRRDLPQGRAALAAGVAEFQQGCTVLLQADHPTLSVADKDWLRERCRKWADRLDEQRLVLEQCPPEEVARVRGEIDAIIRQLGKALQERATT